MKRFTFAIFAFLLAIAASAAGNEGTTKAERNFINQGNKLFNDEQYHAAIESYDKALALNPLSPYATYNKACALLQLASDDNKDTENDPRKVAAQLFQSLVTNTDYPELAYRAAYNLGNMSFNDEDYGKAVEFYKQSLRINPDNRECRQNLLLALKKQEEQQQDQQQEQQQQEEQQQEQQQQQQQQQQQEQQEQPMSQNSEQILQSVQNKENATRRKNEQPAQRSPYTDKPW